MCPTHGVNVLGISEEELELQHLVQSVLLVLPDLLQLVTLLFQVRQSVTNLNIMARA